MTQQGDDDDESITEVAARPITVARGGTGERSPDAIFRSFVQNAYDDVTPIAEPIAGPLPDPNATRVAPRKPAPSVNANLRNSDPWAHDDWGVDQWASSVEELLDDDERAQRSEEPTAVVGPAPPRRPVASLPGQSEPPPDGRPTPRDPVRRDSLPLVRAPLPKGVEEGTLRVVLLTKKKPGHEAPTDERLGWEAIDRGAVRVQEAPSSPDWQSVVKPPSTTTQRLEAQKLVPDVAHIAPPEAPLNEGSEDGMMPGGELDRKLSDMAVLLRYGHEAQVRRELDHLIAEYPRDLLLLRRISEFWVGSQRHQIACEVLFSLASGLFERRNVEGMRQALEQVLVLSPGNERAGRLLTLLSERPEPVG